MDHHPTDHPHAAPTGHSGDSHAHGQQHPLGIYFKIWALLFVLSAASYMVDYMHLQGLLRWSLIIGSPRASESSGPSAKGRSARSRTASGASPAS